jgi:hypothetical protein
MLVGAIHSPFLRHDANGDSVLDFSEFTALVLEIDGHTDESEVKAAAPK